MNDSSIEFGKSTIGDILNNKHKDILKLVAVDNRDVLVNGDDEDGTSDDGISDLVRNDVTLGQVRSSLETLISYFEQTSVTLTSDDNDISMKALDNL